MGYGAHKKKMRGHAFSPLQKKQNRYIFIIVSAANTTERINQMTNEATQTEMFPELVIPVAQTLTKEAALKMSPEALVEMHGGKKSTTIRALAALQLSRSEIAKVLNIRYQHVRNTLTEPMASKK
jgi:hypothetical protein